MSDCSQPPEDDIELAPATPAESARTWDPWSNRDVRVVLCGQQPADVASAIAADAMFDMLGHGSDELTHEVGGLLLGASCESPSGLVTRVEDIVIGDTPEASRTHITFTHATWQRIYAAIDQRDDQLQIVGWYHTHPGFGPFLSEHDLFIHRHFFGHHRQIALVLDPVRRSFSVFGWRDGEIVRARGCHLYHGQEQADELESLVADLTYAGGPPEKSGRGGFWGRLIGR